MPSSRIRCLMFVSSRINMGIGMLNTNRRSLFVTGFVAGVLVVLALIAIVVIVGRA